MTRLPRLLFLTTLLTLTGCTAAEVDCGSGSALQTDLGRYCAYGVIVGGFTCPDALPFAFDIEIPDLLTYPLRRDVRFSAPGGLRRARSREG